MNHTSFKLTAAQFAKLHGVNKRTLHYYDSIGLFSPRERGENGYRYYSEEQSIEFEYIRMLKELNMSIEEIRRYLLRPNETEFVALVERKVDEIDRTVAQLKRTRALLLAKREQVRSCAAAERGEIQVVACEPARFLTAPVRFQGERLSGIFAQVKERWGIEQCRAGIGSYLSLDRIREGRFEEYEGVFTPALGREDAEVLVRPGGDYLCGYLRGSWDKLPSIYQRMLEYAEAYRLELEGYAYEWGMNEFAISEEEEYVTQILIRIAAPKG